MDHELKIKDSDTIGVCTRLECVWDCGEDDGDRLFCDYPEYHAECMRNIEILIDG